MSTVWFMSVPGQPTSSLQVIFSDEGPRQFRPPLLGAGLVQVLSLVFTPPPQLLEQLPKDPQLDQPPSTVVNNA